MKKDMLEDRKQKEIEFANYYDELREKLSPEEYQKMFPNERFYSINRRSVSYVQYLLVQARDKGKGAKVLVYCCGNGHHGIMMASEFGLDVTGIDISDAEIASATAHAEQAGIADLCHFINGDAEHTPFEENTFDLIYCSGCLHHLDLDAAYKELHRILKPNGIVIAEEGLNHNPIIHTYRKLTPKLRTAWEVEHILSRKKILSSQKYFTNLHIRCFHLFTIVAVPFRKTFLFKPILTLMEMIDSVVLRIPGIKWWAWICVFTMSKK
jgi:ubiquinone/menaquinone biosynthesis C-methylase UbiE